MLTLQPLYVNFCKETIWYLEGDFKEMDESSGCYWHCHALKCRYSFPAIWGIFPFFSFRHIFSDIRVRAVSICVCALCVLLSVWGG